MAISPYRVPAWMSFWDKYLAPGDLRQRSQHSQKQDEAVQKQPPPPAPRRLDASHRARRQNALLFGGLAFTVLSAFTTRRALQRKYATSAPKAFTANSTASTPTPPSANVVDGSFEAASALGYATLNVFSMAMLGIGVFMKWTDVADIEDLRSLAKLGQGGEVDEAAEREIESWVAEILARKDERGGVQGGLKESIMEKVAELERKRKLEESGKKQDR